MFSVSMSAADVDWQVQMLRQYPEIANRIFVPAMNKAVDGLVSRIEPNIPHATGAARAEFKHRVSGNGMRLRGRVGWWGAVKAWYINIVEYGARAHAINSYVPDMGVFVVNHPGLAARHFMRKGDEGSRGHIESAFEKARNDVVEALGK